MIRREDHITYTMMGSPFLKEMEPLFKKAGFEYKLLFGEDIPAGLPHEFILGDRKFPHVCCVKSNMNSDDVMELMHKVWKPRKYGEPTV